MAMGWANPSTLLRARAADYACVGVPPDWEVAPRSRERGAVLAAIARILRGSLLPAAALGAPLRRPARGRTP